MVVNLLGQFDWVLDHCANTLLGKSMVVEKKKKGLRGDTP